MGLGQVLRRYRLLPLGAYPRCLDAGMQLNFQLQRRSPDRAVADCADSGRRYCSPPFARWSHIRVSQRNDRQLIDVQGSLEPGSDPAHSLTRTAGKSRSTSSTCSDPIRRRVMPTRVPGAPGVSRQGWPPLPRRRPLAAVQPESGRATGGRPLRRHRCSRQTRH